MDVFAGGQISEVIAVRLDRGEDVLASLEAIAKERDLHTGVVLSGIGTLDHARLHHITHTGYPSENAFVEYDGPTVLSQLRHKVRRDRFGAVGDQRAWAIEDSWPLRSIESNGAYERDSRGQHRVFGEITFRWEVTLCDELGSKKRAHRFFSVTGLASTRLRILEKVNAERSTELAMWRMEVGDDAHPGCRFHVQVLGEKGRVKPPFPHSLSVPRLPGILFTPADSLEFLLAELFQDAWKKHAARDTSQMNRWKRLQGDRLSRLLEWKRKAVARGAGSWTRLKNLRPPRNLFIGE